MIEKERLSQTPQTLTDSRWLEEYLYSMETKGFFVIPNLVNDQPLLMRIADLIDNYLENEKSKRGQNYTQKRFYDIIHHLFDKGTPFIELLESCKVTDFIDLILGDTCVIHSYNGICLAPGRDNNATKIHRDSQRFSRDYTLSVQALIMVDEFSEENGATYLLPGSHVVARRPSEEYFYNNAVRVCGRPGDVVIFNSSVWHCGGENMTEKPRRGITLVYTRSFMKQQFDFCRSIPQDVIKGFDARLRRLIGMNVRVPTSEEEFFLPTEQRLYQPNQG